MAHSLVRGRENLTASAVRYLIMHLKKRALTRLTLVVTCKEHAREPLLQSENRVYNGLRVTKYADALETEVTARP